jgi:uncharacterized protein (TIGR00299 family) protein
VKERSIAIFRAIAVGEARVHATEVSDVHFHEVGALDSIADIVAVAACIDHLDVREVHTSVVPLGSGGFIKTQHGIMPLPAPATIEILKGYPVRLTAIPFELTTPTGAGIVKALSAGVLDAEVIRPERIGFGAGTRELPDRPNLLRVVIGERVGADEHDRVTVVEATIDDMSPQLVPHVIERVMEAGALDATVTSVGMKKGRQGYVISVLAPSGAVETVTSILFRETTTIGVRYHEVTRRKLRREVVLIDTPYGVVTMKKIEIDGSIRIAPEYDEAVRIARERSIPLPEVMRGLEEIARSASHG